MRDNTKQFIKKLEKSAGCESFRTPMQVTDVVVNRYNDSYPQCPRCSSTLEREYMSYCNICGQCLSWKGFNRARVHKL